VHPVKIPSDVFKEYANLRAGNASAIRLWFDEHCSFSLVRILGKGAQWATAFDGVNFGCIDAIFWHRTNLYKDKEIKDQARVIRLICR
jgi:hypothetical protein